MIVSDTSPISDLVITGYEEILPTLYGEVLIPEAVFRELGHPEGPAPVSAWIEAPPPWLTVKSIQPGSGGHRSRPSEESLQHLDPGERAAILLAEQTDARLLLIDETAGREAARAHGLVVTGTIGVLGAAAQKGHLDAADAARALKNTTFRASPDLYRWLLRQAQD
ncbi:MAG: DUF3368 domain-containing protein [Salinibacter sp.]